MTIIVTNRMNHLSIITIITQNNIKINFNEYLEIFNSAFFMTYCAWIIVRVRLDVDIEELGIEVSSIPNQAGIRNESQYQSDCLDVDESVRWKQRHNTSL